MVKRRFFKLLLRLAKKELTKLYNFTYNIKSDDICKSGNLKALEYMLSSFSQIEKDSILYANLHIEEEKEINGILGYTTKQKQERYRTTKEIEEIPYFKLMLNSGANCLLEYKSFSAVWDEEMVDCIEGKKVELNDEIYQKYSFSNFGGQKSVPILVNRKLFSYQDYLTFINKDETDRLRDIVNLKNSNPLRYFDNMVKRGYSDVK